MAGHRKRRDPSARWRERAAKAVTPDEQLAVAYDRLRALIADHRKRDREYTQQRAARASALAAAAAKVIHEMCDQYERESP